MRVTVWRERARLLLIGWFDLEEDLAVPGRRVRLRSGPPPSLVDLCVPFWSASQNTETYNEVLIEEVCRGPEDYPRPAVIFRDGEKIPWLPRFTPA